MPLELLLGIVVAGIAGIAAMLHLSGHSRPFRIDNVEIARREWLRHYPGDDLRAVHLAAGSALVLTGAGAGLLRPLGADTIAHPVRAMAPAAGGLRLDFDEFAAPPARLRLAPETAAEWLHLWETRNG